MPYINYRWLGGMLTNYKTIRQSIKHFKELEALRDSGGLENFTKKEALGMTREIAKMERNLGGIKNMHGLPDVIFVIDVGHEKIAVSEANKLSIPVVGVVDTNHDPKGISYVVPGNDDAIRAIHFYTKHLADAIIEARKDIVEAMRIAEQKAEKHVKKEVKSKHKEPIKKVIITAVEEEKEANKPAEIKHEREEKKVEHAAKSKEPVIKVVEHKTLSIKKDEAKEAEKEEVNSKTKAKTTAAKKVTGTKTTKTTKTAKTTKSKRGAK